MELKIYSPQDEGFLQEIKWNFEELKAEISAVAVTSREGRVSRNFQRHKESIWQTKSRPAR